ncbi:hypothetical protein [Planctomonas psychrotolerans]|uniref:hypothetical protein n=1 Tax=Planctomonas psychrotolerans TaxID=2528712 RepID=UPI001D0D6DED|nr:hypothetical protein [Planctomonas psychrotolerans]
MTHDTDNTDLPDEAGPVGKPSQAEGDDVDGPSTEDHTPQPTGRPSQAEGDDSGQL